MSRKSSMDEASKPGILEKAKRKISDTALKAKEVAIAAKDAFMGEEDKEVEKTRRFSMPIDESMSNEKEEYSHYIMDGYKEETEWSRGRKLPAFR